jgi:lysophospholipase L1-like esterase
MIQKRHFCALLLLTTVGLSASPVSASAALGGGRVSAAPRSSFKFDFGPGVGAEGYQAVGATTMFVEGKGYGFEAGSSVTCLDRGGRDDPRRDFCTSAAPFRFSVAVPEGNYNVTVTLGDERGVSDNTVKAESRRLMLESVKTVPAQFATRTFTVNVRNPRIAGGGTVSIKDREVGTYTWDDKLTVEFSGARPCVAALTIESAPNAITVFLAGDSTVTDQTKEPWAAWGQMLPRFFKPGLAIANHAESGESLLAFRAEHRWDKLLSQLRAGDYVLIQFAHNDQKPGASHVDPFTTYQEELRRSIADVRQRGATPVLVTSMHRRTFGEDGKITNSLGDYPEAMRRTALSENVALIDLNSMSAKFYEALGPQNSTRAFVHYPANTFPGQDQALADNTHFNNYGAYELAKCVVEGIRAARLPLARELIASLPAFDPLRPDSWEGFSL